MRTLTHIALLGLFVGLTGCSVLDSGKINYKTTAKAPTLEVPPDLTQLSRDSRYTVPGSTVTASNYQQTAPLATATGNTASSKVGDVRIERSGSQRWLVVDRPADQLWDTVKNFWQQDGFTLTLDDQRLGIMETDWAENRGKLPQDFIRRTLGKVLDSLFDTGERDKYRTRLERVGDNRTEIYISHRGLVEEFADSSKTQTRWLPRPTDPELEAEFLRRLMIKLGATPEQSEAAVGNVAAAKSGVEVTEDQGQPMLVLKDGFERAWRRVGLTLDRTGFTVEDRDRSQGTYFVRYVAPDAKKDEPGFFAKLFSGTAAPNGPRKYRLTIKSQDGGSRVTLLTAEGNPEEADKARPILKVIADDLR